MRYFGKHDGFSLIEILAVMLVLAIVASVALGTLPASIKDRRQIETEMEMERLAHAVAGNPSLMQAGKRSDFGYIGDVGAFPPTLSALWNNPGGFITWDGPYIYPGFTKDTMNFLLDAWGTAYVFNGNNIISSIGSGSTITRKIAHAEADYILNTLHGTIRDADDSIPGPIYQDSIDLLITIPNGGGILLTKGYHPDSTGAFRFDSLPAGKHLLEIIFTPEVDTLTRYVTILPRHKSSVDYRFAQAYFSTSDSIYNFLVLSTASGASLAGLSFQDEDLVDYYPIGDSAKMRLDGSTVFSGNTNIDAVFIRDNDHIILSTTGTVTIGGTTFNNEDLIDYDPVLGIAFIFLDGSSIFTGNEDINAAHILSNGHIILSTTNNASIGPLSFQADDLIEYDPITGNAIVFLDGATVFSSNADIDAVHIFDNGHVILSTSQDNESIGGLSFNAEDIVDYDPASGTAILYFDGSVLLGSPSDDIDAVHLISGT